MCFLDKSGVNFHIFLKASSGLHIVFHRGGLSKKIVLIIRLSTKTNPVFSNAMCFFLYEVYLSRCVSPGDEKEGVTFLLSPSSLF